MDITKVTNNIKVAKWVSDKSTVNDQHSKFVVNGETWHTQIPM